MSPAAFEQWCRALALSPSTRDYHVRALSGRNRNKQAGQACQSAPWEQTGSLFVRRRLDAAAMNALESSAVNVGTPYGKGRHAERKPTMANTGS